MFISPSAKLSYRYLDARTTPYVHGIVHMNDGCDNKSIRFNAGSDGAAATELSTRRRLAGKELAAQHVGKALSVPFFLANFDGISSPRYRTIRQREKEAHMRKTRQNKNVLRKWNVFPSYADDYNDDGQEFVAQQSRTPVLLMYLCPSHARAQAHAMCTADTLATPIQISLQNAKFLGDRMNVPLCVITQASTSFEEGADERLDAVELYLRMPSEVMSNWRDPLTSTLTFYNELRKR